MKSSKYKVIKLLNEKEILINYGSKQGAKENQKYFQFIKKNSLQRVT